MTFPYNQGPPNIDLNRQAQGSVLPSFGMDSGSANAYAIATNASIGSGGVLQVGSRLYFFATHANTSASTLAVNGGSAIAIKKNVSTALALGDISSGQLVEVFYDGTNFQLADSIPNNQPNFADWETPSGSINGSNTSFTLAHTPNPTASLMLFYQPLNGQSVLQVSGAGNDYTISGAAITTLFTPQTGDQLYAFYRY